jgi:two-component system chemotaxis response regulator CheB
MVTERILRVLVVDDSAYVRKVVKQMLSRSPFIEVVGTARDAAEALEQAEILKPDVVTLDLIMPGPGGLGFLKEQMARRPLPVVVVSIAESSSELVLNALDAGATDFVQKPSALATEKVFEMADELIEKVKTAAAVQLKTLKISPQPHPPVAVRQRGESKLRYDVLVIGISTGGPQALRFLIPRLPAHFPVPIAIVLHMPVGYTEMYARRLDDVSQLHVTEAQDGATLLPGRVVIGQAGRHLTLHLNAAGQVVTQLEARPFDKLHRPSVDVLFRSAAETFGERTLGVLMTGMGVDGVEGASWIKAKGGYMITEAEESCAVYGMPRAAVEAGLSDKVVPLDQMAEVLLEVI